MPAHSCGWAGFVLSINNKKKMENITMYRMREYILSQPDDKPVNMKASNCVLAQRYGCGCLMYQYSVDVIGESEYLWCGMHTIHTEKKGLSVTIGGIKFRMSDLIMGGFDSTAKTFGELKKSLINKE